MRISDWSSDVCSSDLTILNAYCGTVTHHESVSRGRLPERQAIEIAEVRNLRRIWDTANFEDPYYSPGFDRHALPYTRPLWRRPGLAPPGGSDPGRSGARRVGKECVSPWRSRWSPYH